MAFYHSKGFRILAVLVGLLVVALLAAPYLLTFTLEGVRGSLIETARKETGREVEIEKLRPRLLPHLGVEVVNTRIKNPPGFPDGDTLAIESIDVGLAFLPLLSRRVEVTSVTIEGLNASLLQNERGQTNYELPRKALPAPRGRKPPAEVKPAVEVTRIGSLALEDAKISSGTFWSREKRIYPSWEVSGVGVDVSGVDLSDPQWRRKLEARVDLSTIKISTPSLKEPLRFSDGEVKVQENAAAGDFTLALGELRAKGTVKVADLERPMADFTLAMKELNVAEISGAAGGKPKGGSGPAGGAGGGGSRELLARGTVQVDKLIVPPLSAQNLRGQVRVYADRVEVNPFSLELYGGRAQGTVGVELSEGSLPARVNARVEGVNVAQAVAAASPHTKGKITGTFETDARLGIPLGAADPLAALGGEGTFTVRNGTFPGLNVEGTLASMAKFLQMDVPKGDTHFSYFGGDFRISSQRIHSNTLRLQAETLEASLSGSSGFDQTLNYSGSGMLTGKAGTQPQQQKSDNPLGGFRRVFGGVMQQTIGRMRVPFSVTGTFQDPKFILVGSPAPVR